MALTEGSQSVHARLTLKHAMSFTKYSNYVYNFNIPNRKLRRSPQLS